MKCQIKHCTNNTERGGRRCEDCKVLAAKSDFYLVQEWDLWLG